MTLDIGGDLAGFFTDFATPATWRPAAGGSYPVTVIFSAPYFGVDAISGMTVGLADPSAVAKEADLPGVKVNDQIDINSAAYRVIKVRPDGAGLVTLDLKKA